MRWQEEEEKLKETKKRTKLKEEIEDREKGGEKQKQKGRADRIKKMVYEREIKETR